MSTTQVSLTRACRSQSISVAPFLPFSKPPCFLFTLLRASVTLFYKHTNTTILYYGFSSLRATFSIVLQSTLFFDHYFHTMFTFRLHELGGSSVLSTANSVVVVSHECRYSKFVALPYLRWQNILNL